MMNIVFLAVGIVGGAAACFCLRWLFRKVSSPPPPPRGKKLFAWCRARDGAGQLIPIKVPPPLEIKLPLAPKAPTRPMLADSKPTNVELGVRRYCYARCVQAFPAAVLLYEEADE